MNTKSLAATGHAPRFQGLSVGRIQDTDTRWAPEERRKMLAAYVAILRPEIQADACRLKSETWTLRFRRKSLRELERKLGKPTE